MLQASVLSIKKKLFFYDYSRLTWATRTMFASIISLLVSYYIPQQGFWLISSSFITVQLFSFAPPSFSKTKMLIYSITLASVATSVSYFSHWPLFSWIGISAAIFTSFFFFYKGITAAMISMWSMVMLVLNICLPQDQALIMPLLYTNLSGVLIAYAMTFIVLPRRKKDKPIAHMKSLISLTQQDMTRVFKKEQDYVYPSLSRSKLLAEDKAIPVAFSTHYINMVYLLAAINRSPVSSYVTFLQASLEKELALLKASFS